MNLSEKIIRERKRMGLSQEQLADMLGITRQSVSKWEAGSSIPETAKLIAMSELFQVSLDYLLKDYIEESHRTEERLDTGSRRSEEWEEERRRMEQKMDDLVKYMKGYRYTSKTKIAGIPLVSICFSRRLGKECVAKGIIAIGNVAVGIVSFGALSVGVISLGAISLGVLSVAAMAVGLISWGALAIGVVAFGSGVVSVYGAGVAVYGKEIAVGVAASGKTAVGESVSGTHCLKWQEGITSAEISAFLDRFHPRLWTPLRDLLAGFGEHIK